MLILVSLYFILYHFYATQSTISSSMWATVRCVCFSGHRSDFNIYSHCRVLVPMNNYTREGLNCVCLPVFRIRVSRLQTRRNKGAVKTYRPVLTCFLRPIKRTQVRIHSFLSPFSVSSKEKHWNIGCRVEHTGTGTVLPYSQACACPCCSDRRHICCSCECSCAAARYTVNIQQMY